MRRGNPGFHPVPLIRSDIYGATYGACQIWNKVPKGTYPLIKYTIEHLWLRIVRSSVIWPAADINEIVLRLDMDEVNNISGGICKDKISQISHIRLLCMPEENTRRSRSFTPTCLIGNSWRRLRAPCDTFPLPVSATMYGPVSWGVPL